MDINFCYSKNYTHYSEGLAMGSELRKLKKLELLEIILEQEKEIERLTRLTEELQQKLEDRQIKIAKSGSIAEAALQLSGIFEAAQRAADMYVRSAELASEEEKNEELSEDVTSNDTADRDGAEQAENEKEP